MSARHTAMRSLPVEQGRGKERDLGDPVTWFDLGAANDEPLKSFYADCAQRCCSSHSPARMA